jgi:hypothetical protein
LLARDGIAINQMLIMKSKIVLGSTLSLALLTVGLTACIAEKQEQAQLAAQAKVSRADAEKTALTKAPNGTVKEAELEREKGKLIWSLDIATAGSKDITEVAVDAVTGAIVRVEKETPKQQATEKEEDAKEKK